MTIKQKKIIEIIKIVSNNIKVDVAEINIKSNSKDFPKWDSLNQVKIITDLEKKFNKNIKTSQIEKMNSILNLYKYFIQK